MQVKVRATKHTQKSRIRTWILKCGDNLASFKQEVQKRMSDAEEITWERWKTCIDESAKEMCGVNRGHKREEKKTWWWIEEVQAAIKKKKEAFKN
jgi:hypothetical protein